MISIAQVDQALAHMLEAKQAYYAQRGDAELLAAFDQAKRELVEIRRAYRVLQEADGVRVGFVGGDASQN